MASNSGYLCCVRKDMQNRQEDDVHRRMHHLKFLPD
jgi:hypothetical protein